jgi:hypothetical protein
MGTDGAGGIYSTALAHDDRRRHMPAQGQERRG